MIFFETERLCLRAAKMNDLKALHDQIFSDSSVTKSLFTGEVFDEAKSRVFFEEKFNFGENGPYGLCVIQELETRNVIGFAGLIRARHLMTEEYEFGYALAQQYWGKGYATEIARGQVDWALNTLGLKHVFALVTPDNIASIKILEKVQLSHDSTVTLEGSEKLVFKAMCK